MNKKDSIVDRIKDLIAFMGLSEYSFSQLVEIDKSNLSKMLSGQRTIGKAIINKIVLATGCNKLWLEEGEGLIFDIPFKERENTLRKRIADVFQGKGLKPEQFIELSGFDGNELKKILEGGYSSRNLDLAFAIKDIFNDVNLDWLLTGEGDVSLNKKVDTKTINTKAKTYEIDEPLADYLPTSNFKLLPLQSFDVAGGSNNQESDTMGYIMGYMPFVNAKDGDIAVLVTGNSMYPTYPSGSYVQIRKIDYWHKFVEFGQVHIIELMDDRRLIKEVRKGSDKEHFKLISHNTSFDEVEVPTDFIRSVWLVLAKYEKSTM